MSLRVFLALDLDQPIKGQLSRLQNRLDKIGADAYGANAASAVDKAKELVS